MLTIQENPRVSAREIAKTLENSDIASVHPDTVRKCLRDSGLHSRVPNKKPFTNTINKQKRVDFATKYVDAEMNVFGPRRRQRQLL